MTSIQEIRKYRIQLDNPFFNSESIGMSLFDLSISFIAAYILDYYFKLSDKLPGENKTQTYYLLIIPLGIFIHYITFQITFLNKKIISLEFNFYKIILFFILYKIFINSKFS